MNISFTDTISVGKRRARSILMIIAACALNTLNTLAEKIYLKSAVLKALPYDPTTLFIISFILGGALFACALTMLTYENDKPNLVVTALSLLSFTVTGASCFLLGGNSVSLLLSVAFIPSGIVISKALGYGIKKTHAITANSIILALVILFAFAISLHAQYGEVSLKALGLVIKNTKELFIELYSLVDYSQLGITLSQIGAAFDSFILLLPALLCVFVSIISYVEVSIVRRVIRAQGTSPQYLEKWPLTMSILSSGVYLLSLLILTLSANGTDNTVITVGLNLIILFLPGFFVLGLKSTLTRFRQHGLFGMIFGALIIFSFFKNPFAVFLLVAIVGAFDNLVSGVMDIFGNKKSDKNKK